jgi:hypothetical protein
MHAFSESERKCRGIAEVDTEENQNFLNWSDECQERSGTSSIVERARQGVGRLELQMRIREDGMELRKEGLVYKTKKPTGIGRFLTQSIIRKRLAEKVQQHPQHGASFETLKGNEISNKILRNAKYSNSLFRFTVAGRADCLPTPANVQKWYNREENLCKHCGAECKPTLAHIMNKCTEYIPLFTKRHNRLSDVIRRAIEQHIGGDLTDLIMENTPIPVEGLSEEVVRQRPDIAIVRKKGEREFVDLIEFTCPYGHRSHGEDTLKQAFEHKREKYSRLAKEIYELKGTKTTVIPVIVSSMGAVYGESMKMLKGLLKCEDKEMRKIGTQMSTAVIVGSYEIWRKYVSERKVDKDVEGEKEVLSGEEDMADDEGIEGDEEEENAGVARRVEEGEEREIEAAAEELDREDL